MNNLKSALLIAGAIYGLNAQAATIAIIDSGTDMKHTDFSEYVWMNPVDNTNNNRDEDRNGYQDDIYGWNFAESNNEVIDYSYLGTLNDEIKKFFAVQAKMMLGTVNSEELAWLRSKVEDREFIKTLGIYGNFMHGTHVAGIAVKNLQDSKMFAVKLIPTEVKLPGQKALMAQLDELRKENARDEKGLGSKLVKFGLKQLATAQMTQMNEIAYYVDGHKADVANGSFGTGYKQAKTLVEMLLLQIKVKPTQEQLDEYVQYFLKTLIDKGSDMVAKAPNTLFVFAAGNDGMDNDRFPTSPTNIQADNEISVAATIGFNKLAPFSNYGEVEVDVAAPGVNILSAAPGDEHIRISGTSQAAPYVANVAAKIKEENNSLTPKQIKEIIMGTVDLKSWLGGKVKTSGVVNEGRAVYAAELSRTQSVDSAISDSLSSVSDVQTFEDKGLMMDLPFVQEAILPLPSPFKF
ncbi:S8 family serine peptidase [Halobacteriovorax sp. GB3]|uniref:S8 family serine peptidase n=1 Tax=Halobacteriovorax sp. GB3 TaxID=2719615 RepID=UPI002362E0C2|nr:S8 family serine peptidase [Halobacteriovorax sp. GB3]MDD0852958.1 S8 family serine peptidase [Halobacteriovorax sp. GB3]